MYTYPAVKSTQKSTEFYLTSLPFSAIDRLVVLPEDDLGIQLLSDEEDMQRKISWARVRKEMKAYLLEVPDSFYSSLTLFILPRHLERAVNGQDYDFVPAAQASPIPFAGRAEGNNEIGMLALDDGVLLFPGDGQHRAASIKEALRSDPSLSDVRVPVVLIPYRDPDQVRQLFADLNLNAKPVNKTIGYAFETRDPLAIISKQVGETVPLFADRVNFRSNSLPASSDYVITLNTLVEGNSALLAALYPNGKFAELRSRVRSEASKGGASAAEEAVQRLALVWETAIDALEPWAEVQNEELKPGEVREDYVFAHGIGWQALALAAAALIRHDPEHWSERLTETLEDIDWSRSNPEWQGVAMVGTRMNNTGPGVRATAGYILEQAGLTPEDSAAADLLVALQKSREQAPTGNDALGEDQSSLFPSPKAAGPVFAVTADPWR